MFNLSNIGNLLRSLLGGVIDKFKMKNGVAYTIIVAILGTALYGVNTLNEAVTPEGLEVIGEAGKKVLVWVDDIIIVGLTLLGAHTPQQKE